jgi:hypothetical protein
VTREVKAPDGTKWLVRRPMLPPPLSLGSILGSTTKSTGGSSFLGRLLFALVFGIVLALLLLLPITLFFRILLRRWVIEAESGGETHRWRAKSRGRAGSGVVTIAGVIARGESLDQPFEGLKPT